MVTDKDSAERDYSHKTSNKGVAVWLALAVELVKQAWSSKEDSFWSVTKDSAVQRTDT